MSDKDKILSHLKSGGRISSALGLSEFSTVAANQRINELRRAGWSICHDWVKPPSGRKYKEYRLAHCSGCRSRYTIATHQSGTIEHDIPVSDGFGSSWSKTCPMCGDDLMQIVRPGKVQCGRCG